MSVENNHFLELLAPITPRELLYSYWESRALIIPGVPEKFGVLDFDFERFAHAVEQAPTGSVKANAVSANGEGCYISIEGHQARQSYDSGMTICCTGIDREHPVLAVLARETKLALALAGDVLFNCYLSPRGAGFGMHFDMQSVFILQIEGSKHWRFERRPALEFPLEATDALPLRRLKEYRERYSSMTLNEPRESECMEYSLQPGDILYLPPGTWHRGQAGEYSLALTLTCCTSNFAGVLARLLERRLFSEMEWRRNLPATLDGVPPGSLPISVESFIAERLEELRTMVDALCPADFAKTWRSQVTGRPVP